MPAAPATPEPAAVAPAAPTATGAVSEGEWCAAAALTSREKVPPSLSRMNNLFLEAHARARTQECAELDKTRLVVRYAFNAIEARYQGKLLLGGRRVLSPAAFHPIKAVSHAVFLAQLLFTDRAPDPQRTKAAIEAVAQLRLELADPNQPAWSLFPAELRPVQERILKATQEALQAFADGGLDKPQQLKFFERVQPDVELNMRTMSQAILRALDAYMKELQKSVDPVAWNSMLVVAAAGHQSRAREVAVQYFFRLLKEKPDEGAKSEQRLVIVEGVFKAADQYGMISAHQVDQVGSAMIFKNSLRLQWDALGDHGGLLEQLLPGK